MSRAAPPADAAAEAVDQMARELLARGEPVTFTARGASMRPFLRDGDRVTVAPLTAPPRPGDLVLVATGGSLGVVHRVLWRDRRGRVRTKGDALPVDDGWHDPAAILGRVAEVRRAGRPVPLGRWLPLAVSLAGGLARRHLSRRRARDEEKRGQEGSQQRSS